MIIVSSKKQIIRRFHQATAVPAPKENGTQQLGILWLRYLQDWGQADPEQKNTFANYLGSLKNQVITKQ